MRKLCFVLTTLLLTVPVLGAVDIDCAVTDGNLVTVSYTASDDANLPRAFGLDISVNGDGKIQSLVDLSNDYYWVHPGNITIVDGNVTDEGSPIGAGAEGTNSVTLEMGSLYADDDPCHPTSTSKPGLSDDLVSFRVSGSGTIHVTISGNATRGNVVLETTAEATVVYTGCDVVLEEPPCFPEDNQPDYDQWVLRGSPSCWCNPRQCHGDAAGDKIGTVKLGYYYVGNTDLNVVSAAWKKLEPPKGSGIKGRVTTLGIPLVCADFAHDKIGTVKLGYYYVGNTDLNAMSKYWKHLEVPKGSGTDPNCLTEY